MPSSSPTCLAMEWICPRSWFTVSVSRFLPIPWWCSNNKTHPPVQRACLLCFTVHYNLQYLILTSFVQEQGISAHMCSWQADTLSASRPLPSICVSGVKDMLLAGRVMCIILFEDPFRSARTSHYCGEIVIATHGTKRPRGINRFLFFLMAVGGGGSSG